MALMDYLTQTTNQQGSQSGQQQQQQQYAYNPAQQAGQSGLGGFYNQLLQGNIPQQFTNPQPAIAAFNANFDNTILPQYAAQYGAGSNVGLAQKSQQLQQLQGQLYNTGVGNFMNALGGYQNYAFNPTGQNTSGTTGQTSDQTGQNVNTINPIMQILMQLLSGIGGS